MNATKTIKLPEMTHRRLKVIAAETGVSLSEMIARLIDAAFPSLKKAPGKSSPRENDPVSQAFANAPDDDEPLTDKEKEALEEARKEKSVEWGR
ncbi:MAG: hypothetical protein WA705_12450 [Candidatus Ozemobacteraceae bacterium]